MIGEGFEISEASLTHRRPTGARPEVFTEAAKPSFFFAAGGAESQAVFEPVAEGRPSPLTAAS
jgi:hypothetical protein